MSYDGNKKTNEKKIFQKLLYQINLSLLCKDP